MFKVNEKSWSIALIDYQNSKSTGNYSNLNKLMYIKNSGEILNSDLALLDDFYPCLLNVDKSEAIKLKNYIKETFDMIEI